MSARAACLWVFVPALAFAQPTTPGGWYDEGEKRYELGEFERAADAFKEALRLETNAHKRPSYIYNIAQAYRFANKCREASFFYKRFLATVPVVDPGKRNEVEKFIAELEECVRRQDALASKPPTSTMPPADAPPPPPPRARAVDTSVDEPDEEIAEELEDDAPDDPRGPPRFVVARAQAGIARTRIGEIGLTTATFTVAAAYPIALRDDVRLELGASASYVPLGFETSRGRRTASLVGAGATAGVGYDVARTLTVRGELGAGAWILGGLVEENPFTVGGVAATGALPMFAARVALSADYAITPNVIATATPVAFAWSPARSDLRTDIDAITSVAAFVGIGYRR